MLSPSISPAFEDTISKRPTFPNLSFPLFWKKWHILTITALTIIISSACPRAATRHGVFIIIIYLIRVYPPCCP
jgi:hypothetical protein